MHSPIIETTKRPGRHGRLRPVAPIAIALVSFGLLVPACSHAPSGPRVAGAGSSAPPTASSSASVLGSALAYSQCMRNHGIGDFPDPDSSGTINLKDLPNQGSHPDLQPDGSRFQAAERACQSLQPTEPAAQQRRDAAQALEWSQCMRAHGVADFPDPDSTGDIHVASIRAAGIDVSSSQFQAAANACRHYQPNTIRVPGGTVRHERDGQGIRSTVRAFSPAMSLASSSGTSRSACSSPARLLGHIVSECG